MQLECREAAEVVNGRLQSQPFEQLRHHAHAQPVFLRLGDDAAHQVALGGNRDQHFIHEVRAHHIAELLHPAEPAGVGGGALVEEAFDDVTQLRRVLQHLCQCLPDAARTNDEGMPGGVPACQPSLHDLHPHGAPADQR